MKKILSLAVLLAATAVGFGAAATYVETGIISYPTKLDVPPFTSLTYSPTNPYNSSQLLWPVSATTNSGQLILTNVVIPIERGEGIGVSFTLAQQGGLYTPSGSNNIAIYGDLSYDGGRTFTTTRPISGTYTYSGSNAPFRPTFYIPYTNTAEAQIFRLTAFSNSAPAGGSNHIFMYVTNVVLTTRKAVPR